MKIKNNIYCQRRRKMEKNFNEVIAKRGVYSRL